MIFPSRTAKNDTAAREKLIKNNSNVVKVLCQGKWKLGRAPKRVAPSPVGPRFQDYGRQPSIEYAFMLLF
jgi:hypothetical protein